MGTTGKMEGKEKQQKLDMCSVSWDVPANPTFLLLYYALKPKISGESDGKRDKNVSYNRSVQIKENWKKPKIVCG